EEAAVMVLVSPKETDVPFRGKEELASLALLMPPFARSTVALEPPTRAPSEDAPENAEEKPSVVVATLADWVVGEKWGWFPTTVLRELESLLKIIVLGVRKRENENVRGVS